MYLGQLELELDAVEKRGGAGRLPQEVPRSRHDHGLSAYFERGMSLGLERKKRKKAREAVGAEITQVLRRG